jgi:hypothetical protein
MKERYSYKPIFYFIYSWIFVFTAYLTLIYHTVCMKKLSCLLFYIGLGKNNFINIQAFVKINFPAQVSILDLFCGTRLDVTHW